MIILLSFIVGGLVGQILLLTLYAYLHNRSSKNYSRLYKSYEN